MLGKNDLNPVGNKNPAFQLDRVGFQVLHFRGQGLRVHDHSVSQDTDFACVQDTGRNQVQGKVLAGELDRVPGIVAALESHVQIISGHEEIDDFPFSLITPLQTYHR